MMLFGDSIISWVIRLIAAVFVFFLLAWALPLLLAALTLRPPQILITLVCLLAAALVLFSRSWTGRLRQ
jgi:hypothetical protein